MKTLFFILLTFLPFVGFTQTSPLEEKIYELILFYKGKFNGNIIVLDQTLSSECRNHSVLMGSTNNLSHDYKMTSNGEIIQRTNNIGCTDDQVAQKVLNNFLGSKVHKDIIESSSKVIGVGVFIDKNNYVWVTIRFN